MSQQSKLLLLLGENTGKKEGAATVGTWGKQHTIPNNSYTKVPLNGVSYDPKTLLPVISMSHGIFKAGDTSQRQTGIGQSSYGPVNCAIDPVYLPVCGVLSNLLGANGLINRINFKLFAIRSVSEGGDQKEHHYFTLTGTNGWIKNVGHQLDENGDHFMMTMSATVWQWEHYDSAGGLLRMTRSAHFDLRGKDITDAMVAK